MKQLQHIQDMVVVERETPMNPEALKEIRDILEGVKSGQLLHDQSSYHSQTACGTAHCVAGWKAHNDAIKAGVTVTYNSYIDGYAKLDEFMNKKIGTSSEWDYAQTDWDLSRQEAEELFKCEATLDEQFELLEVLEAGCTIKEEDDDWQTINSAT